MITYARLLLYPGEVLRIDADEALEFQSEHGRFWLTADDAGVDHALDDGESSGCVHGRIVVEGEGILLLRPACPERWRLPHIHRGGALQRMALRPAA